MKIYLDDDSIGGLLVRLLNQAGHDVELPATKGLTGVDDVVHLTHAVKERRVLLSRNQDDFQNLHDLVLETRGAHSGIMIVCYENNPRRDMSARDIVQAIGKLVAAGVPIENQFTILNHWR